MVYSKYRFRNSKRPCHRNVTRSLFKVGLLSKLKYQAQLTFQIKAVEAYWQNPSFRIL